MRASRPGRLQAPRRRTARCRSVRAPARVRSAPHQRDAGGMRNDHLVWDLRPRAFARISTCLGERNVSVENVVTGEPQLDQGHRSGSLVMPVAHGAASRKRVAGHGAAGVQGLLSLIVQECWPARWRTGPPSLMVVNSWPAEARPPARDPGLGPIRATQKFRALCLGRRRRSPPSSGCGRRRCPCRRRDSP